MLLLNSLQQQLQLLNRPTTIQPFIINSSLYLKKNLPLVSFFASSFIATTAKQTISLPPLLTDAAWTIFLQSSLILGIWSKYDQFRNQSIRNFLQSNVSMLIAFVFGCIGSYIGGYLGFTIASLFVHHSQHMMKLKMIASCITASYIGGTANFFETSELLITKFNAPLDIKKSLHAVAGIDIGIMVVYFSLITTIQSFYSRRFQQKLSSSKQEGVVLTSTNNTTSSLESSSPLVEPTKSPDSIINKSSIKYLLFQAIKYYIIPLGMAICLCTSSSYLQSSFFKVPGVSVILSTLSSLLVAQIFYSLLFKSKNKTKIKTVESNTNGIIQVTRMEQNCDILSEIMLTLFYIIIGTSSKLTDIITVGPPAIILISVALVTHLSVLGLSSHGWNLLVRRMFPRFSSTLTIDVDTAVIARYLYMYMKLLLYEYLYILVNYSIYITFYSYNYSNACVGGSSTAANMANSISRFDLIFPATVAGLFGYILGTPLGLSLSRILKINASSSSHLVLEQMKSMF